MTKNVKERLTMHMSDIEDIIRDYTYTAINGEPDIFADLLKRLSNHHYELTRTRNSLVISPEYDWRKILT